ncbi:hypothetical protein [Herbaspirillum robiniae]|uniref:hypothetical protein n=1 Tax=Herbaspirillum robiniae TaxID=2014887 RepID=UPI0011E4CB55|nr:hypothetical protein [Herbaspirillum robiniae]
MKDEQIFSFFEFHVHESLADFYKDSTLPSDQALMLTKMTKKKRRSEAGDALFMVIHGAAVRGHVVGGCNGSQQGDRC